MEPDAAKASSAAGFATWRAVMATELRTLAALHCAELDSDVLERLGLASYPAQSVLPVDDDGTRQAVELMRRAVADLRDATGDQIDELAADFAAIYLTGALHLSPNESAWLDEDHLERQQPMFEVRAWYRRFGLRAADWRCRPEDNLTLQLSFIAALLDLPDERAAMSEAASFMDQHLLLWLDDFCGGVAQRCSTQFYAALALYTGSVMGTLRGVLEEIGDLPRAGAFKTVARTAASSDAAAEPLRYMPGVAPSW